MASASLRRNVFPPWVGLLCIAAAAPVAIVCIWGGYFLGTLLPFGIAPIVTMLLGIVASYILTQRVMTWLNRWMIGRVPGSVSLNSEASLMLGEEGVRYVTPVSDSFVSWPGVSHVFEHQGTLFFATGLSAFYVPARCFSAPEARKAAVDYAMSRMTLEARKRSRA